MISSQTLEIIIQFMHGLKALVVFSVNYCSMIWNVKHNVYILTMTDYDGKRDKKG